MCIGIFKKKKQEESNLSLAPENKRDSFVVFLRVRFGMIFVWFGQRKLSQRL